MKNIKKMIEKKLEYEINKFNIEQLYQNNKHIGLNIKIEPINKLEQVTTILNILIKQHPKNTFNTVSLTFEENKQLSLTLLFKNTKIMKKYLLTDFNTENWKGINMENVKSQIEKLNDKINKIGFLLGEIENPETFDISLSKASHTIKNLTFKHGKVYGDIEFLNNDNGKQAYILVNNMNCKFGIRSTGIYEQENNEITIHSIITWDIINKHK